MYGMRFTFVDHRGSVSFVEEAEILHVLVGCCSANPTTAEELLHLAEPFVPGIEQRILNGLALFDERNVAGHTDNIQFLLRTTPPGASPIFRVLDDLTRETSLQPVNAGIVLFNLVRKRIVQIHNTYAPAERKARYVLSDTMPRRRYLAYELPSDWSLVP